MGRRRRRHKTQYFPCEAVGAEWLDSCLRGQGPGWRYDNQVELDCSAQSMFMAFKEEKTWNKFLELRIKWSGKGDFSARRVKLGVIKASEEFFEWEEDEDVKSFAFRVSRSNVGSLQAMAERWVMMPGPTRDNGTETCVLQWQGAVQLKGTVAKFMAPLVAFAISYNSTSAFFKLASYMRHRRAQLETASLEAAPSRQASRSQPQVGDTTIWSEAEEEHEDESRIDNSSSAQA